MLWFLSYKPKTAFYPYVLFLAMGAILVGWLGHVDLFVNLTLLNIIAVYSLFLSIIIFKIITKNSKISLKLPIQGQQPNNGLSDSSENFRADRS